MIYPIVSIDSQLTIFSTKYSDLVNICTFLKREDLKSLPIYKNIPKPDILIEHADDGNFKVDCGSYEQNVTIFSELEYYIENLRLFSILLKDLNVNVIFYMPKIPPSEYDKDFLYITMLSHIFIPVAVFPCSSKREKIITLSARSKFLQKQFSYTTTMKYHSIFNGLTSRIIHTIKQDVDVARADDFMILRYGKYFNKLINLNVASLNSNLVLALKTIFKYENLNVNQVTVNITYGTVLFDIVELFSCTYQNIFVGVYVFNGKLLIKYDTEYYDFNNIDEKTYFLVKTLLFSLYNCGIEEYEGMKLVSNSNIFGKFYIVKLQESKSIEYFFIGSEYDKIILTEIFNK